MAVCLIELIYLKKTKYYLIIFSPLLSSCVPIIGNINNENIYPLNLYNNNMQKQDDLLLRQKANNLSPVNIRSKSFDVNNPVNLKNELTSFNYDKTGKYYYMYFKCYIIYI